MVAPQTWGLKGPLCSSSFTLLNRIYLSLVLWWKRAPIHQYYITAGCGNNVFSGLLYHKSLSCTFWNEAHVDHTERRKDCVCTDVDRVKSDIKARREVSNGLLHHIMFISLLICSWEAQLSQWLSVKDNRGPVSEGATGSTYVTHVQWCLLKTGSVYGHTGVIKSLDQF